MVKTVYFKLNQYLDTCDQNFSNKFFIDKGNMSRNLLINLKLNRNGSKAMMYPDKTIESFTTYINDRSRALSEGPLDNLGEERSYIFVCVKPAHQHWQL